MDKFLQVKRLLVNIFPENVTVKGFFHYLKMISYKLLLS